MTPTQVRPQCVPKCVPSGTHPGLQSGASPRPSPYGDGPLGTRYVRTHPGTSHTPDPPPPGLPRDEVGDD